MAEINKGLSHNLAGPCSEHYCAAYFLSEGWNILWPSQMRCRYDFVIAKGEKMRRVQVKTGLRYKVDYKGTKGKKEYEYWRVPLGGSCGDYAYEKGDCDLLAVRCGAFVYVFSGKEFWGRTSISWQVKKCDLKNIPEKYKKNRKVPKWLLEWPEKCIIKSDK